MTCTRPKSPDKRESEWINEQLVILERRGIPLQPADTVSDEDAKWLRVYIKRHASKAPLAIDLKSLEKRFRFKLPKSYVDFVRKVGAIVFDSVDEKVGARIQVLLPKNLDAESYRVGVLDSEDEATNAVDGVMFAHEEHGDCFCFDVKKGKKEFRIFQYKHEYNMFEAFADNFAACIRRFAGGVTPSP